MSEMIDRQADLLISARHLLTMHDGSDVIEDGAVAVCGDSILEIGKQSELIEKYPTAEHLHQPGGLIMPGLVNVHTHAAMSCFRGLADDLPLMEWLQEHIFPAEARINEKIVYQATLLSTLEMIRSGTTSFCDMYLFAHEVARAADKSGMRSWIGEVVYDFPSPCYGEVENCYAHIDSLAARYASNSRVNITVDPHAIYTCSPDLLVRLKEKAAELDTLYVIHLAETQFENDDAKEKFGLTPVKHLESLGVLDHRVVADHCVVLTDDEISLLADKQVKVAHCPESNMKLASGVAPIPQMLKAGLTIGIGTDGPASNNDVDMFGEMDTAAKLHKVKSLDPTVMDAFTTLHMATLGGAAVLGAEQEIGSLAPGKKADMIILDMAQPHLTPLYDIPSHLVYAARGADVVHSIINGQMVMKNRQFTQLDENEILANVSEIAAEIKG